MRIISCLIFFILLPFLLSAQGSKRFNYQDYTIKDPLTLSYEYIDIITLDDGSTSKAYVEKGGKNSIDGDYTWSKSVPIYASSEIRYAFEYQMDFADKDLEALISWLKTNMGEKVSGGSIDRPSWYNHEMSLTEVYNYCKKHNKRITMGYNNDQLKKMVIIVIDSGSSTTRTAGEIGLVYMFYKTL